MIYTCLICNSKYKRRPSQKGKYCNRECFYKSTLGHVCSEETRRKIGEKNSISKKGCIPWNKGLKGYGKGRICSEKTKQKISASNKGRKATTETRKKQSLAHMNKPSPKKGKRLSDKTRIQISLSLGGDGILSKRSRDYPPEYNKKLRQKIHKRDNYICQYPKCLKCLKYNDDLTVHHIDYNKKNSNKNNLITLCRVCHSKTNFNRDYWKQYFKGKVKI